MDLKTLIAKVNKTFGDKTIGFARELGFTSVSRMTSGSLFLDWALGQNEETKVSGWPIGRIVELYGPESAGKSLISLITIAHAQKEGKVCAYLDAEGSFDRAFAIKLGVDVDKLLFSRESGGEALIDMACELLRSKKVDIIIFDSLAAMIPKMEVEDPMEQAQMAPVARMMSRALRKLTFLNEKTLMIFINQLRVNPGAKYGNPEYTPGGRALKFYASLRVDVRQGDWLLDAKDKKKKIGQVVKFRVVKNKTTPPYREGYFKFLYKGEFDKVDELISIGILNEKIKRKGSYFYLMGKGYQGREELEKALKDTPVLFKEAKKEVFKNGKN